MSEPHEKHQKHKKKKEKTIRGNERRFRASIWAPPVGVAAMADCGTKGTGGGEAGNHRKQSSSVNIG